MGTSGWNRSGGEAAKPTPKKPSAMRGVIAGAVVVAAAVAIFFAMSGKDEKPKAKVAKTQGVIKEVKPAAPATNSVAEASKKPVDPREDYDHEKCYRDSEGVLRMKDGNGRVHDPAAKYVDLDPPRKSLMFSNTCDAIIFRLIATPGGARMRNRRGFRDPEFVEDMMESLKVPVELKDTDTDYQREAKTAVNETKKELLKRVNAGENLSDILENTHKELQRLYDYRENLKAQVENLSADGNLSERDLDDLYGAANKMLEENGVKPLKESAIMKRKIKSMLKTSREGGNDATKKEE